MTLHDVLRHLVAHTHFPSEDNRAEALAAVDDDDPRAEDKRAEDRAEDRAEGPGRDQDQSPGPGPGPGGPIIPPAEKDPHT